jgi:dynactin complex subunit
LEDFNKKKGWEQMKKLEGYMSWFSNVHSWYIGTAKAIAQSKGILLARAIEKAGDELKRPDKHEGQTWDEWTSKCADSYLKENQREEEVLTVYDSIEKAANLMLREHTERQRQLVDYKRGRPYIEAFLESQDTWVVENVLVRLTDRKTLATLVQVMDATVVLSRAEEQLQREIEKKEEP